MKEATTLPRDEQRAEARFAAQLRNCLDELALVRKANRVTDIEIRQLRAATRKKLDRIRENLRHVEATR
jgi:hypothetical protein